MMTQFNDIYKRYLGDEFNMKKPWPGNTFHITGPHVSGYHWSPVYFKYKVPWWFWLLLALIRFWANGRMGGDLILYAFCPHVYSTGMIL